MSPRRTLVPREEEEDTTNNSISCATQTAAHVLFKASLKCTHRTTNTNNNNNTNKRARKGNVIGNEQEGEEANKGEEADDDADDDDVGERLKKARTKVLLRQRRRGLDCDRLFEGAFDNDDDIKVLLSNAQINSNNNEQQQKKKKKNEIGGISIKTTAMTNKNNKNNHENGEDDPQMQTFVEQELEKHRQQQANVNNANNNNEREQTTKLGTNDDNNNNDNSDRAQNVDDFDQLRRAKEDLWKTETYYANAQKMRKDEQALKETKDRNLTGICEVELSAVERAKTIQATEDAKKRMLLKNVTNDDDEFNNNNNQSSEWIDMGVKNDNETTTATYVTSNKVGVPRKFGMKKRK
jgi:hypothetical protein